MSRVAIVMDAVPQGLQASANWTSFGTSISFLIGVIQGPLAVLGSILSAVWLGLQIYAWFERRRRPSGRRRKGDS